MNRRICEGTPFAPGFDKYDEGRELSDTVSVYKIIHPFGKRDCVGVLIAAPNHDFDLHKRRDKNGLVLLLRRFFLLSL
jgi:hypothetical protein